MFSLRTLLLAVAVVAIGLAGLTTRSVWWSSVMSTLTLASIAAAIIGTIVSRGQSRLFAIGFAIFVSLYLYAVFSKVFQPFAGTLLTTQLVATLWRALDVPQPESPSGARDQYIGYGLVGSVELPEIGLVSRADTPEWRDYSHQVHSFFVVAHSLWAWLFGFLGALLAGLLARERSPSQPVSHTQRPS
jgi:hypothetical protein